MSRRNSSGWKRGISTRCWPLSSAMVAEVKPVLWLNGTGTMWVSVGRFPIPIAITSAGRRPSPPASISFGRPVLPPEAIDFHAGETTSGSGASESSGLPV